MVAALRCLAVFHRESKRQKIENFVYKKSHCTTEKLSREKDQPDE